MFDINDLMNFLVEAKKSTYAAGDASKKVKNEDHSTTIVFEKGDWRYHDNYFGGEPYGGREVAFFKGQPAYIMTYYGQVDETVTDLNQVYGILMNALKLIPTAKPYRGPESYTEGDLSYFNKFSGEIDNFFGEEIITNNGKTIYKAKYMGGLVDLRK